MNEIEDSLQRMVVHTTTIDDHTCNQKIDNNNNNNRV